MFVPLGGSSSTETTHSPASSLRSRSVLPSALARIAATSAGSRSIATSRAARLPLLLDCAADRRDLRRRRSRSSRRRCARRACVPAPRTRRSSRASRSGRRSGRPPAREADVRLRRERESVRDLGHLGERGERRATAPPRSSPRSATTPAAASASTASRADTPASVSRVLVERELRDDRKRRDGPHGGDGGLELLQVEERLDHEQVDAASLEKPRLLEEDVVGVLAAVRPVELAERADRARDEDLAAGDLARLTRELDAGLDDLLELLVEEQRRRACAGWRRTCSSRSAPRPRR